MNNSLELVRTDSTTVKYIPQNKLGLGGYVGSVLSPLGRIRRIERLNKEFIKEYNEYKRAKIY